MKKCFIVVALFAMTMAAYAAPPDFSGEWKLNLSKSDYGPIQQFAPEFMVRTIKHQEPALHISTHQKGAQGEVTTELDYTTDGKMTENKGSKGSAKWEGEKIVVDSVRDFQGNELKNHDVWSLSPDGKMMTVTSHLTAQGNEFDLTLVFDKQ